MKATKKKVLFIDRDGTLIKEAPPTYQIDSFDKLEFYPDVFWYMRKIAVKLDFELVMVSNQDGMGTDDFPENTFHPVHNFVMKAFENEGISFSKVFIDRSLVSDNSPSRKPGIGMLLDYLNNPAYDIPKSFVIGDRITDIQLAKNLGCNGIWLKNDGELGLSELKDPESLKSTIALTSPYWRDVWKFLKGV